MKYQIYKPTLCHVNAHVWIWAGMPGSMPNNWTCDCGEFEWEKAFQQSVQADVCQSSPNGKHAFGEDVDGKACVMCGTRR